MNGEAAAGARVAITGGAGFLGAALARRLLDAGSVSIGGAPAAPLASLVLADIVAPPAPLADDPRVRVVTGDVEQLAADLGEVDLVFHLAGVVSGAAEADFDLGMHTNVDGLRAMLETLRAQPGAPVIVYSSSGAVFGQDPALPPLGVIDDDTLPRPQSSYGIQKFLGELLVADYTRKGFLRGRSVRLQTVAVRPGKPNAAASSFVSGIIREPLAGERAVCPVPPDMPVTLLSPDRTLDGILLAASVADDVWGSTTAMTFPALTTTPREMAAALSRVAGQPVADLIEWTEDPAITAIVGTWAERFSTPRASRLGLVADASVDEVIAQYAAAHRV
ncbi:D-erythronate dehydrogenase [Pseudolysinimonas sp.]|uniref:D-erythronate dehydrogenase n=1 Tax=Pseudolysinimonas sp. TaxID=2680009 RepID=UPI003F805DE9